MPDCRVVWGKCASSSSSDSLASSSSDSFPQGKLSWPILNTNPTKPYRLLKYCSYLSQELPLFHFWYWIVIVSCYINLWWPNSSVSDTHVLGTGVFRLFWWLHILIGYWAIKGSVVMQRAMLVFQRSGQNPIHLRRCSHPHQPCMKQAKAMAHFDIHHVLVNLQCNITLYGKVYEAYAYTMYFPTKIYHIICLYTLWALFLLNCHTFIKYQAMEIMSWL